MFSGSQKITQNGKSKIKKNLQKQILYKPLRPTMKKRCIITPKMLRLQGRGLY